MVALVLAEQLYGAVVSTPGVVAVALECCGVAGTVSRALVRALEHLAARHSVPACMTLACSGMAGPVVTAVGRAGQRSLARRTNPSVGTAALAIDTDTMVAGVVT